MYPHVLSVIFHQVKKFSHRGENSFLKVFKKETQSIRNLLGGYYCIIYHNQIVSCQIRSHLIHGR
eukprot:UN00439